MARYRYAGPGPQDDGQGGIVRPGEEREFDAGPGWGPWEPVPDGGAVTDSAAPAAPAPAPAPDSPGAAAVAPAAATPAGAPSDGTEA